MIKALTIENFKIHEHTELEMRPLTLLTGVNGMGKSSVTQLLLMLRESVAADVPSYPHGLRLKGETFDIGGDSGSLVNWYKKAEADLLKVTVKTVVDNGENEELAFRFVYPLSNADVLQRKPDSPEYGRPVLARNALFNNAFQYLSAWRLGPEGVYSSSTSHLNRCQISGFKGRGEYAVSTLSEYGNNEIAMPEIAIEGRNGATDARLSVQTEEWLSRISTKIRISINETDGKRYLKYIYPGPNNRPMTVKAVNTGFGISYILSAIVALLVTPPDGLVIIENPEAHLHPAAQSEFMKLVSRVVAGGVQVIIETHSDHIIFGALVNCKKSVLDAEDVKILHFDTNTNGRLEVHPVRIGPDCRIKNPPKHFVEQMNLDLDVLFDE